MTLPILPVVPARHLEIDLVKERDVDVEEDVEEVALYDLERESADGEAYAQQVAVLPSSCSGGSAIQ